MGFPRRHSFSRDFAHSVLKLAAARLLVHVSTAAVIKPAELGKWKETEWPWNPLFKIAVRLFSNRSQMTSKCDKNKNSGTRGDSRVCHWCSDVTDESTCFIRKTTKKIMLMTYASALQQVVRITNQNARKIWFIAQKLISKHLQSKLPYPLE